MWKKNNYCVKKIFRKQARKTLHKRSSCTLQPAEGAHTHLLLCNLNSDISAAAWQPAGRRSLNPPHQPLLCLI